MRIRDIGTIFTLVLLIACQGKSRSMEEAICVDVKQNYPKKELILQDFLDVEYIPLETNDEFITAASLQAVGENILLILKSATN